ncbi:IS5 family transposase [Rhabdochlamydiaceae symbiont of Dictyostelium giganteum]|uniref:IS5 family transposase n=1 Tax=Rhabdochlamydiaceae symbiont of Dictyostelium giganteum TaxID=3342349 RepID=UPI00384B5A57
MKPKSLVQNQDQLFKTRLSQMINPNHELCKLAASIPWQTIEEECAEYFTVGVSRPPVPTRVVVGILILQNTYNFSDESVVSTWVENVYWQFFCGYDFFQQDFPIHPTTLTRWRQRLGPEGLEKILKLSISVAVSTKTIAPAELNQAITDTTVMPKAISYPVDAKLLKRSLERIVKEVHKAHIPLKRTYLRVAKKALFEYQKWRHCKRYRRAATCLGRLRTYVRKVLQELDPILETCPRDLFKEVAIGTRLVLQERNDTSKIYSCHEPHVSCIAKGKVAKPYEFGCKVCILLTEKKGIILSSKAYPAAPYNGHLLKAAKKNGEENSSATIRRILVDLGFRKHDVDDAEVLISRTKKLPRSLKKVLKRRQAIEPWIGHMKQDCKLGRCYLKGILGDQMQASLSAIGHNFRIILRKLRIFYALLQLWTLKLWNDHLQFKADQRYA